MILSGLKSKPLHPNQRRLLDVLVESYPDSIKKADLEARLPEMIVASVIGGLGNRWKHIPGWPARKDAGVRPSRHAIGVAIDASGRVVSYCAKPELVEAWRRFKEGN